MSLLVEVLSSPSDKVIRTPVRINLSGRKGLYELMLQGISVYDDKEGKA